MAIRCVSLCLTVCLICLALAGPACAGSGGQAAVSSEAPARQAADSVPAIPDMDIPWQVYLQAVGTMFLLVAVLGGSLWLMRRSGRFAGMARAGTFARDGLFLERQLPLGQRKHLVVVRFLNKRLLLGVTEQRITLLAETECTDASFQQYLESAPGSDPAQRSTGAAPS